MRGKIKKLTHSVQIRLTPTLYKEIEGALATNESVSDWIRDAIKVKLEAIESEEINEL